MNDIISETEEEGVPAEEGRHYGGVGIIDRIERKSISPGLQVLSNSDSELEEIEKIKSKLIRFCSKEIKNLKIQVTETKKEISDIQIIFKELKNERVYLLSQYDEFLQKKRMAKQRIRKAEGEIRERHQAWKSHSETLINLKKKRAEHQYIINEIVFTFSSEYGNKILKSSMADDNEKTILECIYNLISEKFDTSHSLIPKLIENSILLKKMVKKEEMKIDYSQILQNIYNKENWSISSIEEEGESGLSGLSKTPQSFVSEIFKFDGSKYQSKERPYIHSNSGFHSSSLSKKKYLEDEIMKDFKSNGGKKDWNYSSKIKSPSRHLKLHLTKGKIREEEEDKEEEIKLSRSNIESPGIKKMESKIESFIKINTSRTKKSNAKDKDLIKQNLFIQMILFKPEKFNLELASEVFKKASLAFDIIDPTTKSPNVTTEMLKSKFFPHYWMLAKWAISASFLVQNMRDIENTESFLLTAIKERSILAFEFAHLKDTLNNDYMEKSLKEEIDNIKEQCDMLRNRMEKKTKLRVELKRKINKNKQELSELKAGIE